MCYEKITPSLGGEGWGEVAKKSEVDFSLRSKGYFILNEVKYLKRGNKLLQATLSEGRGFQNDEWGCEVNFLPLVEMTKGYEVNS